VECAIKDNREIIEKEQEIILPIRKSTPPSSLKVAAVNYLKTYKAVHLDCIGVAANYVATKAIIMIRAHLFTTGDELIYVPIYKDFKLEGTENKIKTGIRWTLTLYKRSI